MLLIRRITPTTPAQGQEQVVKSPVVMLARDMKLGDRIAAEDVTLQQIPVDVIPRDAVSTLEAAIGRYIKADMVQGEMLLQHNLADPTNNNHDLSFILSEDHVLMAFPATDLMSEENVIQRGDVIDILATYEVSVADLEANNPPVEITAGTPTPEPTQQKPPVNFTIAAFQKVSVTALVLDIIPSTKSSSGTGLAGTTSNNTENVTVETNISSYLLALSPQDALVLKHLKDLNANFDIVLRSPTSTLQFELSPVEEQYIIELYGLRTLP
jgi:Flp pilus assembly protein CpaB